MRRVTVLGWVLLGSLAATAVLAIVAPGAALVAAIILALAVATAVADGFGASLSWCDVEVASERKREALAARLKRGRPEWETTPPDHADEPADAVWQRERERRGLR
ncbi:MAG TPA: hypothetical protein VFY32_10930 [Solirubrobacteraceae bacterium]|nr:hypothetical protein [Solirubrobacteraceae bacterium]